jgi:hypothetical protein
VPRAAATRRSGRRTAADAAGPAQTRPAPVITSKKTATPLLPSLTQFNARLVCSSSCWDRLQPRRGGRSTHGQPRAWPQHRQDVDQGSPRLRPKRHHRRRRRPAVGPSADTNGGNGPGPTRRRRCPRPSRRRRGWSATGTVSAGRRGGARGILRWGAYPWAAWQNPPGIAVTPGGIRPEYGANKPAAAWHNTPVNPPPRTQ